MDRVRWREARFAGLANPSGSCLFPHIWIVDAQVALFRAQLGKIFGNGLGENFECWCEFSWIFSISISLESVGFCAQATGVAGNWNRQKWKGFTKASKIFDSSLDGWQGRQGVRPWEKIFRRACNKQAA